MTAERRALAPGDWDSVYTESGGVTVFDYTDVRYGGYGSSCHASGEVANAGASELVVANSSLTDSQNAAIVTVGSYTGSFGVYNSEIGDRSCMGIAVTMPGELDVTGNTFNMPPGNTALLLLYPNNTRVWFNTVNGLAGAAGSSPTTRAMADFRFNVLSGIYDPGTTSQSLNDWSDNWWGVNANSPLPACMDPNVAASSVPQVSVSASSTGCPSGQDQVTGYT